MNSDARPTTPDAHAFTAALAELGVEAQLEVRGALALLVPTGGVHLNPVLRRRVEELARIAGFSHVAVELLDPS